MPEIAIKQSLNDSSFRRGLSESADSIEKWGKEAQAAFNETRSPMKRYAKDLSRLEKLHRDGYIAADTYDRKLADLQSTLSKQTSPLAGIQDIAGQLGGGIGKMAGALLSPETLGTGAIVAAGAGIMHLAEGEREASLNAEKLGVGLHVFHEMEAAASTAGVGVETFRTSIERMEKNLGQIADGEAPRAGKALASLGLDVEQLTAMTPDKAFVALASAIMGIESRFERARLEADLFGKSGMELEVVLKEVKDGFEKFNDFAVSEESGKAR